ncbi:MAG: 3-hydroxyacyl-CoA dehydrogenase family protein [Lachnospiraceae bacterium]|nr:3-hydroxyacyl-CoA dehydrogenase family protein [Lachnospiraceae bacterium]
MRLQDLKTVAVIGAGDMGHGIAQVALMAGYQVRLCDIKKEFVERGISRIYASLDKLVSKGKFEAGRAEMIKNGQVRGFVSIAEAVAGAELVVEAVPESLEIKKDTLRQISEACGDGVIATNSSTMSITMLAEYVEKPENMVGIHYFNPAVLMKLVEVICGDRTSGETAAFACAYAKQVGKTAVLAKKDRPGFIANRIVAPVVVYNGLCIDREGISPADIDLSMMRAGQKMGPMELADYTGVDVTSACQDYYHEHLSPEYGPSETARKLMAEGHLGKKTGRGYYLWPEAGRPELDESLYTGRYDPKIPNFIQANEACKLYEEGVCTLEECDTAMILGYNMEGPIAYIQNFAAEEISGVLNRLADKYNKEIFRPVKTIRTGAYKR